MNAFNDTLTVSGWTLFVWCLVLLTSGAAAGFMVALWFEVPRLRRRLTRDTFADPADAPAARQAPHFGFRLKDGDTEVELSAPTLADLAAIADWHGQSIDVKG